VARIIDAPGPRHLPTLTDATRAFWTGGASGELLVQRCVDCRRWVHPAGEGCPTCGGELRPEPVSGRGTVFTFTVNHQQFNPDVALPYVIAIIELDEQADLRIPTNLIGIELSELRCGQPVQVLFERHAAGAEAVYVPVFEPIASTT
jgi:uncharacterized OB-fold protein